jgi:antitoxin (DNA-binding transcriptional repressor) of toxin-antitoxin stability system
VSRRISATDAVRNLSRIMDEVRDRGVELIVERRGLPVCKIGPVGPKVCTVEQLSRVLAELPRLDDDYLDCVERLARHQPKAPKKSPWD